MVYACRCVLVSGRSSRWELLSAVKVGSSPSLRALRPKHEAGRRGAENSLIAIHPKRVYGPQARRVTAANGAFVVDGFPPVLDRR